MGKKKRGYQNNLQSDYPSKQKQEAALEFNAAELKYLAALPAVSEFYKKISGSQTYDIFKLKEDVSHTL